MKKSILFIAVLMITVLMSSCTDPIQEIRDPKGATTLEQFDAVKDTMLVTVEYNQVCIYNDNGYVIHRFDNTDAVATALLTFIIGFVLGAVIIAIAMND